MQIYDLNEGKDKMRVYVDSDVCCGCGPCVDTCPEAFALNVEGIAVVKVDEVPEELQGACWEAAEDCPTVAIAIEE